MRKTALKASRFYSGDGLNKGETGKPKSSRFGITKRNRPLSIRTAARLKHEIFV
jgi:hypothetical protein